MAPASAFDAERLDTFKIGRVLRFTPVEEADRKDIRRWWATLNRAVKDTKTPWRTATQASEAIKLALGIVEYGKTVGGQFMQWPKSLKELDDEELAEAVRDMAALLHKMTGVDPLEWSKESADVGRDETEQPGTSAPDEPAQAAAEVDNPSSQGSAAADQSAGAAIQDSTSEADSDEILSDPRDPRVILNLKAEAVSKFIDLVSDTKSVPDPKDRRGALVMVAKAWKAEMPHHHDFLKTCFLTSEKVIKGEMPVDQAREYLGGLVK